jgi:hypothetical protein
VSLFTIFSSLLLLTTAPRSSLQFYSACFWLLFWCSALVSKFNSSLMYSYELSFVTCYSCSTTHSITCSIFVRRSCCSHFTCRRIIWSTRFSSSAFIWIRRCFYHSLRYSSCYPSHFTWSTSSSYIDSSRSQIWSTDTSTTPAAAPLTSGGSTAPVANTTPAGPPPAVSLGSRGVLGAKREMELMDQLLQPLQRPAPSLLKHHRPLLLQYLRHSEHLLQLHLHRFSAPKTSRYNSLFGAAPTPIAPTALAAPSSLFGIPPAPVAAPPTNAAPAISNLFGGPPTPVALAPAAPLSLFGAKPLR